MTQQIRKIYLAGKVGGIKHELAKKIDSAAVQFVCSDYDDHSEHGWGYGIWEYSEPSLGKLVQSRFVDVIKQCEMLVAVLNTGNSYGSIAEIAYASALEIPSVLIIYDIKNTNDDADDDENHNEDWQPNFADSYWFVSNFPQVLTIKVSDDDEAFSVLEAVSLMESPMEWLFYFAARKAIPDVCKSIRPQVKFPTGDFTYRVDFLYEHKGRRVAIEIDGHDAHKTREQRTHDAQKDRFIKSAGVDVMRFTGTELNKDALKCVKEFFYFVYPELVAK